MSGRLLNGWKSEKARNVRGAGRSILDPPISRQTNSKVQFPVGNDRRIKYKRVAILEKMAWARGESLRDAKTSGEQLLQRRCNSHFRRNDLQGVQSSEVAARPESVGKRQESHGSRKRFDALKGIKL